MKKNPSIKEANIHKIGLLLKNSKQTLLGSSLLTSLNYEGIPFNKYEEFLKTWKSLDVLMLDEENAKEYLHKIKELIKRNQHPLLIILILEKNQNFDQWVEVDIHDIIRAPIEKIDLMLALSRVAKLKNQMESRLDDLRKFSEKILNQTQEFWDRKNYKKLLEYSPYGIIIVTEGKVTFANDSILKMLSAKKEQEILGYDILYLFEEPAQGAMKEKLKITKNENKVVEMLDEKLIRFDGTEVDVEILASPFIFENKPSVQLIINDISKRKAAEHQLTHLAYHDSLTGLANRSMLENVLNQNIMMANRKNERFSVLFLDLDHFKMVNDTLGHPKGDLLLKAVAERLSTTIRKSDLVARLGGDEFVLILGGLYKTNSAGVIAEKIMKLFKKPFTINDHELFITTSLGISIYPDNGKDAATLLKNADIAMYVAKERGRNNYQFCTPELTERLQERAALENYLRHAINEKQLLLHYQPIVDIKTNKITGIEALLRWNHPNKGLLFPVDFIELAEESGLIVPFAEWVIRKVCQDNALWTKAGAPQLTLSINLSVRNLKEGNIVNVVEDILKETSVDGHYLEFEITESLIMQDVSLTVEILDKFKAMGIHVAIDDFGIGYSSLSYLKRFDIDRLKIDKTFIQDVASNPNSAAIVTAIIAMSHSLNMKVVAEGVETQKQLDFLKKENCDEIQGNYYCKPIPAQQLVDFFKKLAH